MLNDTMAPKKRPVLALFLAGSILVTGCTAAEEGTSGDMEDNADVIGDEAASTGEDTMTSDAMAFESPDADDFNLLLETQDDLQQVVPLPILNVLIEGDDQLILGFEMESHKCFGIHTTADETDREIIIGLETGLRPGVEATNCTYGVFPYTAAVALDAPVGDRTIVVAEPTEPSQDDDAMETSADTRTDGDSVVVDEPSEADQLIGLSIEEGVEWAIANSFDWRVLSFDGEVTVDESPEDVNRISFVVERDLITSYEWS